MYDSAIFERVGKNKIELQRNGGKRGGKKNEEIKIWERKTLLAGGDIGSIFEWSRLHELHRSFYSTF